MPAETFSKPLEQLLVGACEYDYYNQSTDTYSKTSKTRICRVRLTEGSNYNSEAVLMVFTIRNQSGKWKIHSEGAKRMDSGATVPLRNSAVSLAKNNGWKYLSIALAGEDVPATETVAQYVVVMESYSYGNETVYDLTKELDTLQQEGYPNFYRCKVTVKGNNYSFSFVKKDYFMEYLKLTDNRSFDDQYGAGAKATDSVVFLSPEWFRIKANDYPTVDSESDLLYQQFQSLYSPEKLAALTDQELLGYIFLGVRETSLCHALEYDPQYTQFGSFAGGTGYKYNLYYSSKEASWKTSHGDGGQRSCTEAEALEIGKEIRDALVKGAEIIANYESLDTPNDYNSLLAELTSAIPQYINKMWFLKYYHMLFPSLIALFYSETWHKHVLCNLNIVPSDAQFVRMGQINCFVNDCGISNMVFSKIIFDHIGSPKIFYRIGTGENGECFEEWHKANYVAIGWNELGDLSSVYAEDSDSKTIITDALKSHWNYDNRLASRKYGEINNFYSAVADTTYVVAMNGKKLLAIGVVSGGYYFDDERAYGHCRPVQWLKVFEDPKMLPVEDEGKLTTFCELKNSENICYLYTLLHGDDEVTEIDDETEAEPLRPINIRTGIKIAHSRNRILFGAPGTGKSFTLNGDRKELLYGDRWVDEKTLDLSQYGAYERVTFHPDYSYANFVGTYKPVPCIDNNGNDAITYEYVPGPFMRVYVKALQSSRTDDPKPFLLIIEEINRANVAAVFGDVFQLLDRDDDEVSEYSIQASEDIKKYLASKLGGSPNDYSEIQIPDNMLIWATMNSADQGVFPMDTAFKRRWDFTYLGIDDSEAGIVGKKVILGKGEYRRIVEWNALRKAINEELLTYKVNEDKLMGPYFISKKNLPDGDVIDPVEFTRIFKNKVIMYLFDDAAKQKRVTLFGGCDEKAKNQYSKICAEFDTKGVFIFCEDIRKKFIEIPEGTEE